eukprot:1139631-Pelagomonas_calceolata.AAC.2
MVDIVKREEKKLGKNISSDIGQLTPGALWQFVMKPACMVLSREWLSAYSYKVVVTRRVHYL